MLNLFSMPDLSSNSGKQTTADKPPNTSAEHLAKTLESSEIRDVQLAGEPYKLFMQPVRISLYEPGVSSVKNGKFTEDWIVAGLIRTDRFRGESLRMSYTLVLLFLLAFALVILSTPFVKVKYLGPRNQLQTTTIIALAFSLSLISAIIGFSVLDLYIYPRLEHFLDGQLKSIADQAQRNFNKELTQISAMMSAIGQQDPQSFSPVETDLLRQDVKDKHPYLDPDLYFSSVIWLNKDGQQERKWTIMDRRTPFFSLPERTYFRNARDGRTWRKLIENGSGKKTVEFWLEPVQSVSSGQSEAIAAMPLRANQPSGPYRVLTVVPNLISVRGTSNRGGPVLPPTFGFMLVENNGSVLFQSSGTYPDQNLIEECDGDRELLAALSSRASELMNVVYLGRSHRFYADSASRVALVPCGVSGSGVPECGESRDRYGFDRVVRHLFVCHFMAPRPGSVLALQPRFGRVYDLCRKDAPQHDRNNDARLRYQALALSCGLLTTFYIYAIKYFDLHQLWYTVLAVTLFTLGIAYVNLGIPGDFGRWRRWAGRLTPVAGAIVVLAWIARYHDLKSPMLVLAISGAAALLALRLPLPSSKLSLRGAYLLAMSGLLLVTSLLPAVGFFSIAYRAEMIRYARYNQISFLQSLLSRRDYVERFYRDIKKPDDFVGKRLKSELDVYGTALVDIDLRANSDLLKIPLKAVPSTYESPDCIKKERFQWLLLETRPLYNAVAAVSHELTHDSSGDCAMSWTNLNSSQSSSQMMMVAQLDHGKTIKVTSENPNFLAPDGLEWWALLLGASATGLFLMFVGVEFFARRVFFLDHIKHLDRLPSPPRLPVLLERSILLLGASSWRKTWPANDSGNIDVVDLGLLLREAAPGQPVQLNMPSQHAKTIVVLENLDYGLTDHETNRRKVEVIEKLLHGNRPLVAMSVVDPMNFSFEIKGDDSKHEKEVAAQYRDRWARILSGFSRQYVNAEASPDDMGRLLEKAEIRGISEDVRRLLVREAKPSADLVQIATEILDAEGVGDFDRRRLLIEIGDRANAYYRTLWAGSSLDEKFALFRSVQDGFLNSQYSNINSLLRSLLGRGLIQFDRSLRLMNDSFRQFVRNPANRESV